MEIAARMDTRHVEMPPTLAAELSQFWRAPIASRTLAHLVPAPSHFLATSNDGILPTQDLSNTWKGEKIECTPN